MVNNCAACTKTIRTSMPSINCMNCSSIYHPMCVNISDRKMSEDFKSKWSCPLCHSKEPKRDNSNTPVRTTTTACAVSDVGSSNALLLDGGRKTASPAVVVTEGSDNLAALTAVIELLRADIGEMKSHIVSLSDHVKECFSRIDEHEKKLVDAESRLCSLEQRESEIVMCRNKIVELQHELHLRGQAGLRNEIEIAGINEFPEENSMHIVQVIAHKIGASIDVNDLDYVTRVGPRSYSSGKADSSQVVSATRPPRPLVVRFLRRHNRDAFLKAGKARRNLSCADVGVSGAARNIYINERLTQENRQLFRTARRHAKSADYKFCRVKGGIVYIRKREGNPAVPIRNMDELERLLGPPAAQDPS